MRSSLTVAGIEVEVSAPRGPLEAILVERYAPFLGAIVDPVCRLRFAHNGMIAGQPNPPMAIVRGGLGPRVELEHVDFHADLDLTGDGMLEVPTDPYAIDHVFRLLFGLLAPRHDALMLHACGVISGGVGHVFAGRSGAGKSTLASLADDRPLLSDEHVMVRRIADGDGAWIAASTPFWGSYSKPGAARQAVLGGLWSLRQWPTNEVRNLDGVACLRIAIDNAVLPGPDPDIKRAVFDVAVDLAAATTARELRFTPVPTVWEQIDARAAA